MNFDINDLIEELLNDVFGDGSESDKANIKTSPTPSSTPKKKSCPYKVIINEPAVILIIDGKKYISKADREPFDEEKGLLMCLAKANGFPFDKVHKMLKNAQRTQKS